MPSAATSALLVTEDPSSTDMPGRAEEHAVARVRGRLRPRRASVARRQLPGGPRAHQPRLLIVDDDESALRLLHHTLVAMGDIHYAKRGDEALEFARRLAPDLILLDARMPGCDGLEVCRALKAEAGFEQVPIVLVTSYADPATERRAFEAGAADFIAKPYTPAVVQARVRNLLASKRRTDAELDALQAHWRRMGDARVAGIVNAATEAIVSHDAQGQVVLANAAAGHMFGFPHELLIGRSIQSLLGADFPGDAGAPGEPLRRVLHREHGPALAVEAAVSSVGEGAQRLVTVILRDAGARDRVAQLERARAEMEEAARDKRHLLSCIAHEMGNPLNGVLAFAELMSRDQLHALPPEQARRLELILASGRSLQNLLRDVVELGHVESGSLKIETAAVDAALSVATAVETVAPAAASAGVVVWQLPQTPLALSVMADAARLCQCLANLLSNAVKYNRPGGRVEVEIRAQGGQVAIAVRDNGLGMSSQQLTHLFEPFNRLGRQNSATPGTGLGLWITRQLARAMHGALVVESHVDQGSCFTLLLPRCPDPPATQERAVRTDSH